MQIITIAGNIGKDAEIRTTGNGDKVAGFSVAVDNGKDSNGNRRDSTWFDCSLWGKRAESLAPYIKKGGKITVSGRPTAREHNGMAYLGINVDQVTLQGGNQAGNQNVDPRRAQEPEGYVAGGRPSQDYDDLDQIPF